MEKLTISGDTFWEEELVYDTKENFLSKIDELASLTRNVQASTYPNNSYHLTKSDIDNDVVEPEIYHKNWLENSDKWGNEYLGWLIYSEDKTLAAIMTAYKNIFTYDNPIKGAVQIEIEKVWLGNLFIDPKYQGKGLGSYLMNKLILWSEGLDIGLNVVEYNTKAIRFYERFGFKYSYQGKGTEYKGKLIPEICMWRVAEK